MTGLDPRDVMSSLRDAFAAPMLAVRRMSQTAINSAALILNTIRHPVIMVDADGRIVFANADAEDFFRSSASMLSRDPLERFVPFGSPLLTLIDQVRERRAPFNEYRVDISSPRLGTERLVDLYASPVAEIPGAVVVMFQERSMADKIDRQMTHRGAARSVTGLAAMLAHEIKNPLSGIRGAAQLLETAVGDEDRALTRLIPDETDRIVALVDRMEVFSDERPIDRHAGQHPRRARPCEGDRAQRLCEPASRSSRTTIPRCRRSSPIATSSSRSSSIWSRTPPKPLATNHHGEIKLSTAFRPGMRIAVPGTQDRDFPAARVLRPRQRPRRAGRHPVRSCSTPSSPPSRTGPALALRWLPRSSASMAASSSAIRPAAARRSASSCRPGRSRGGGESDDHQEYTT